MLLATRDMHKLYAQVRVRAARHARALHGDPGPDLYRDAVAEARAGPRVAAFFPALFVLLWSTGFIAAKYGLPVCAALLVPRSTVSRSSPRS